ncbi:MAG: sugar-binding protein, partial [Planctomycetota bacterium]
MVSCPRIESAVRLDGSLAESAWKAAEPRGVDLLDHIHPNYREKWTGPDDLSGRVRAVIVGEDLYLGIEVTDDVRMHETGRSWWAGDSVEIFFDTDRQTDRGDSVYSADDLQLFLMPFHDGLRWGVVSRGPEAPYPDGGLRGIRLAHRESGSGYVIEALIPLSNLHPLQPDEAGEIGFDVAFNDVDSPGSPMTETYMTLSGRFDLYAHPDRFARMRVGPRLPEEPAEVTGAPLDWLGLAAGLAGLILGVAVLRSLSRRVGLRTRLRTASMVFLLVAGAALCSLLPSLATLLDERAARDRASEALQTAEAVALSYLDLDESPPDQRAINLLALFRDGSVAFRPRYRYRFLPTSARSSRGPKSDIRYGLRLEPGEERTFPLEGTAAPQSLWIDLWLPQPGEREAAALPAAEISVLFEEGEPVIARAPRKPRTHLPIDTAERAGEPMRALRVRSLLSFQTLVVEALRGQEETGDWRPLPLASLTPAGVPVDVWRGTPTTHVVLVPKGGVHMLTQVGLAGDRLWLALGAEGAYPHSTYGEDVAVIKVRYRDGGTGPELRIRNGRDIQDHELLYARSAGDPSGVALEWEGALRLPLHYTLHSVTLDAKRAIDRIEIEDLGVLQSLKLAAATLGVRSASSPPSFTGVVLRGDRISVRDEARELWSGLGFTIRTAGGALHTHGPTAGVARRLDLPLGDGARGTLEVWIPHSAWAAGVLRSRTLFIGFAALLLALAVVIAGAALLQRARHLRIKMLAALGAATVVPLLFMVVALTALLNERAESDLKEATLADLGGMRERIQSGKARARGLASRTRDTLEIVYPSGDEALSHLVRRSRAEIEAQSGFLRLPELDSPGPSPIGNVSLVDAISRSGLYYSAWDGLMALGIARTAGRRRYLVGLRAHALLGPAPSRDVSVMLYGPEGEPLAATGGLPARMVERLAHPDLLERTDGPHYDAEADRRGEPFAAAHTLLKDRGRTVGILGVYRSRAPTEATKAAIFRTLLLSGLAALLLVVLAGATLV